MWSLGRKKTLWFRFPTDPIFFLPTLLFFQRDWPCDPIFSRWLRTARTACQNGVCCHTNYWTKWPKFVHRKYASLVNIDVGTLLQIAQQKKCQNHEKNIQKKIISDLPTLIFSRYETGTTGIFFTPCLQMNNIFQLMFLSLEIVLMKIMVWTIFRKFIVRLAASLSFIAI
jgi:hypothetical protein